VTGVFSEDVVVERIAEGRYRALLDHSWDLMPLPQGGIVASFGLRAATESVADPAHRLRTCTAVFAGRVAAGPLEIEAVVLRRGRSATQVMASVRNPESASGTTVLAVFGSDRRGPAIVDVAPPSVPTPSECRSYRDPLPAGVEPFERLPFWERVEGRAALGHAPWEEYEPDGSDVATWLRFDDPPVQPDGVLDPLGVLTLADRMPGSVGEAIGHTGERWFAPSADLTVHFFEPARTRWLLAHDRARWAGDGWASAETTLWTRRAYSSPTRRR
jgi:hypothetical protein